MISKTRLIIAFLPYFLLYGCANIVEIASQVIPPIDSASRQPQKVKNELSPELLDFLMRKDEEEEEIFAPIPLQEETKIGREESKKEQEGKKIESPPTA